MDRFTFIAKLRNMSDEDVFELDQNPDHPFADEIADEADYRASINRDNRVAQAMGEVFEENRR